MCVYIYIFFLRERVRERERENIAKQKAIVAVRREPTEARVRLVANCRGSPGKACREGGHVLQHEREALLALSRHELRLKLLV